MAPPQFRSKLPVGRSLSANSTLPGNPSPAQPSRSAGVSFRNVQYSFQDSPAEDIHFRSDNDEADTEETSFSGQEDFSDHNDILDWAKENHHGSLQIICEYYHLSCPQRGSSIIFQPLEHLQPLDFQRSDEKVLHIAGSSLDLKSCSTSFEISEVSNILETVLICKIT